MADYFKNSEDGPAALTGLSTGSWNTSIDLDLDATYVGSAPIIAGKEMPYIIMLGSGLVFIYDVVPLLAAYYFAEKLPDVFANAHIKFSEKTVKIISVTGILILLVQASLAISDIDSTGRIMIVGYIALVIAYIQFRSKHQQSVAAEQQAQNAE